MSKYHDHPLQFANKYYFQVRSGISDENYHTIIIIMALMTVLPLTLLYAIGPLTVVHIYPVVFGLITDNKAKAKLATDYADSFVAQTVTKKKFYYKKLIRMAPFLLTSIGINIGFIIIHILSVIRFIQCGDEVLDPNVLPIIHAVVSLLVIGGVLFLSVTILVI